MHPPFPPSVDQLLRSPSAGGSAMHFLSRSLLTTLNAGYCRERSKEHSGLSAAGCRELTKASSRGCVQAVVRRTGVCETG